MFDPEKWPPFARLLDRPAPVWLPARTLWPDAPGASYVGNPNGLMTGWEIPGVVHALLPTMYGSELAVVTCQLQTKSGEWSWTAHAQLVPAHLLKRRRPGRRSDRFH
jgi:hypothetical protein